MARKSRAISPNLGRPCRCQTIEAIRLCQEISPEK
jgi:hypothetical protein